MALKLPSVKAKVLTGKIFEVLTVAFLLGVNVPISTTRGRWNKRAAD